MAVTLQNLEKFLHMLANMVSVVIVDVSDLNDKDVGVLAESLHLVIDQWVQYKLGTQ